MAAGVAAAAVAMAGAVWAAGAAVWGLAAAGVAAAGVAAAVLGWVEAKAKAAEGRGFREGAGCPETAAPGSVQRPAGRRCCRARPG